MTENQTAGPDPAGIRGDIPGAIPDQAEMAAGDSAQVAGSESSDATRTDASDPEDGGYGEMLREYLEEQRAWITPALRPLVFHLQRLGKRLDADPDAPVAMSSAYLQAFSRLDKNRPGATPQPGDGLVPVGDQPSIFDPMD